MRRFMATLPEFGVFKKRRLTKLARDRKMVGMRVRYDGETDFLVLTHGKIYDVIAIERGWYRVVDDSGEDYLFPAKLFTEVLSEE